MNPTILWKFYIIFCYLVFYFYDYDLNILLTIIGFTIIFILSIFFLKTKNINFNIFIPPHKINLLWVVLILLILFVVSYLQKSQLKVQKEQNAQFFDLEDYLKIKNYQYGFTFFGNVIIKKVLYPGMYIGELRIQDIKKYYKNKKNLEVSFDDYKNKIILVALNTSKKDLWENCKLDIFFYGKVFFYPMEAKNSFFEYLLKNNAHYFLKLQEKNIRGIDCNQNLSTEIKEEVIEMIKKFIKNKEAEVVLIGLVLGNSNWMDKETKDKIKKLGLLHLFAASGLHLGIIFYVLFFPLSKVFGKKHFISYLLPLPFLLFYLYLLNFPYTLVRAFIFIAIIGLLMLIHKKSNSFDVLLNTFIVMILIFPLSVINLSTFMSFMAVSGILFFYKDLQDLFIQENRFPKSNIIENLKYTVKKIVILQFIITFSASFFFQPFLFHVFRSYSLLSPLYNMIFVPIISIFLPILFLSIILTMVFQKILFISNGIAFFWNLLDLVINTILYFMNYFYKYVLWLEFSSPWNFGFISSFIFVVFFLGLSILIKRKVIDQKEIRKRFLIAYALYQTSLLIYYVWNIHFLINLRS